MSRSTLLVACAAAAFAAAHPAPAQTTDSVAPRARAAELPRRKLSGPRFGFTTFTGAVADMRDRAGLEPIMTQFGWQWETQILSLTGGNQALMEWVLLVGGVEQEELNVSLGWLTGYRLASGLELGVGPNFSYNRDSEDITSSMVLAGGSTLPFGDFFVPVNVAIGAAKGGPRLTVLTGWIIG